MNSYLVTDLPTIYADMNVYRYVACGDMTIADPERFTWVYSHIHLDEIHRNGNTDALEGMKLLRAVELCDALNERFQSVGNIIIRSHVDPYTRFEQHQEAVSGYEDAGSHIVEHLLRIFGADNYEELRKTPDQMREEIERIVGGIDADSQQQILETTSSVSEEMKESIEKHLKHRTPIDNTRNAFGVTSEARKHLEKSDSPIDEIWKLISPAMPNITQNQFFGFEPNPGIEGIQHTQHGAISGAHVVLNLLGINPDKGLAKRDRIKSIMSDGQHAGMASYCHALLSADRAFISKAKCIYTYLRNITNALHFEYQKGYVLNLGTKKP
jgi:hypothetical protein